MTVPLRGQVHWADVGHGEKPWVVISNNQRNRILDTVMAVRVITTSKHSGLPTVVAMTPADPLVGFILADDIEQLGQDELVRAGGVLSPRTLAALNEALKIALALP